jgi:ADP-ribose pyrophosphatase YjhB (NUDIX family)
MIKGIDYTGVNVTFYCHDGLGNYLFHKRSNKCRDEQGMWHCGGGGLKFNETLEASVAREIEEEYGVAPVEIKFLGHDEVFREHEGNPTHWIAFHYRVLVDRDKVINNEPEKHEDLTWYKLDALPSLLHSQVVKELKKYKEFLV